MTSSMDACLDSLRRETGAPAVLADESALQEYSTDASPCRSSENV